MVTFVYAVSMLIAAVNPEHDAESVSVVLFPAAALIAEPRDVQVLMVAVVLKVVEDSKDDAATDAASPAVHTGVSKTSRKKSQRTFESIQDKQFDRGSEMVAAVHAWLARVKSSAPIGDEGEGNILSIGRNRQARRGRVRRAIHRRTCTRRSMPLLS
jgi:hypothetical protein